MSALKLPLAALTTIALFCMPAMAVEDQLCFEGLKDNYKNKLLPQACWHEEELATARLKRDEFQAFSSAAGSLCTTLEGSDKAFWKMIHSGAKAYSLLHPRVSKQTAELAVLNNIVKGNVTLVRAFKDISAGEKVDLDRRRIAGADFGRWPQISIARAKKREYSRCRIACSTPPIYWSTFIQ